MADCRLQMLPTRRKRASRARENRSTGEPSRPTNRWSDFAAGWGVLAWVAAGVVAIGAVREPLAERYAESARHEDVSLLLSPDYTLLFSLGHREALADYLFATLLVRYGVSFADKRPFAATFRYLDTITTLAPDFERPYLFADTLLTMLPQQASSEAYDQVRTLHERGLRARPYSTELWSVAGQFAAYLAPPRLPPERRDELRLVGARLLARACELAGRNANIPYHCIAAARILHKAGEKDAMVRMLARTLAVQDDPQVRDLVHGYMRHARGVVEEDRRRRRVEALEREWKREMPHVPRNMLSLLGPTTDALRCAGPGALARPGCASSWRAWSERRLAPH